MPQSSCRILTFSSRSASPFWRTKSSNSQSDSGSYDSKKVIGASYSHTDILKFDSLYGLERAIATLALTRPEISLVHQDHGHHQLETAVGHLRLGQTRTFPHKSSSIRVLFRAFKETGMAGKMRKMKRSWTTTRTKMSSGCPA